MSRSGAQYRLATINPYNENRAQTKQRTTTTELGKAFDGSNPGKRNEPETKPLTIHHPRTKKNRNLFQA